MYGILHDQLYFCGTSQLLPITYHYSTVLTSCFDFFITRRLPKSPVKYSIRSARNLPAPHTREFVIDSRVVAKWADKHYYIGRVISKSPTHPDK